MVQKEANKPLMPLESIGKHHRRGVERQTLALYSVPELTVCDT